METSDNNNDPLESEKLNCYYLYKKYIKETHARMRQFKDELLAACVEFLLSLPKQLAVLNMNELFDALQISLELGVNYLPMAENALNSLEYWLKNISLDKLRPFYSLVLNKLDDYLHVSNAQDSANASSSTIGSSSGDQKSSNLFKIKLKGGADHHKKIIKQVEKSSGGGGELYERVQMRILKIVGQLAGEMSHCLYEASDQQERQLIAWDNMLHLKFAVPFVDVKPAIYFDRFMPRVAHLALSSTNRHVKINACELLHAIVVYMIGKSVSDPQRLNGGDDTVYYDMSKLYKRIYPFLFRLACDVDQFARTLFHPLCMQIIHWFTGNRKYESAETVELLACIMDSLVDEKDAALRDFGAQALNEFLKWSIKHAPLNKTSKDKDSSSLVNVKSALKRIFSYLVHPSRSRRLGAALAWNNIYVLFREEESLVSKHIFELLYYLVESLALADKDDKIYGTLEHAKLGLDHVERIIRAKSGMLNELSVERAKPPGWSEAVLEVAVRWLVRQCGRIETECRHKCMVLVYRLAPSVAGIKDTRDYFQSRLRTESELYFLARFEGSTDKREINKDSLANYKTLAELSSGAGGGSGASNDDELIQLAQVSAWLSMLNAPLDCYTWVLDERLLTASSLFGNGRSCIWHSLSYFIQNIINKDLAELVCRTAQSESTNHAHNDEDNDDQATQHKLTTQSTIVCSPSEIEQYRTQKCTVIVRLMDFLCAMLSGPDAAASMRLMPESIWCDELFECLLSVCIDAQSIGFDLTDADVYAQLPLKIARLLRVVVQHAPAAAVRRLRSMCARLVDQKRPPIVELLVQGTAVADWLRLAQLLNGYEQLDELDLHKMNHNLNRLIMDRLWQSCERKKTGNAHDDYNNDEDDGDNDETITCVEAKRKLLGLCLSLNSVALSRKLVGVEVDFLVEILDKYLFASGVEDTTSKLFYNYYKSEICASICKRNEQTMPYILSKLKLASDRCISLFVQLVENLTVDKHMRKAYGQKVVQRLYTNWSLFGEHWQRTAPLERKTMLVTLLTKCMLIESIPSPSPSTQSPPWLKHVADMYMQLLSDPSTKLNFKCKLLDLLHFFCELPPPHSLRANMSQLMSQLPLKSAELDSGTDLYNDYVNTINRLLVSLTLSSSFELMHLIVSVYCRERTHLCESSVQQCMSGFVRRLDAQRQLTIIEHYWEASFKCAQVVDEERKYLLFDKVLMTLLRGCDKPVLIDFVASNILFMMSVIDAEAATSRERDVESVAANKRCMFELVELAYKRLHRDEIFFAGAKVCSTYECGKFGQTKDGKELTKEVIRKCRKHMCAVSASAYSESVSETMRQMRCAAYNCLAALFMRTQTEPKLYLAFLFKDDPAKVRIYSFCFVSFRLCFSFFFPLF
jgi:DNA-dependent protein kinase catalytic subunit